jgi:SagB-type dehydrogenase family enzyme
MRLALTHPVAASSRPSYSLSAAFEKKAPAFIMAKKILDALALGSIPLSQLESQLFSFGTGPTEHALLFYVLTRLLKDGTLELEIAADMQPIARVQGVLPDLCDPLELPALKLSRFTSLRPFDGSLIVETPFKPGRVVLLGDVGGLICTRLSQGTSLEALRALSPIVNTGTALPELVKSLIAIAAMETAENGDVGALAQWEHHDAIFHARTRGGRSLGARGGTYRFLGQRKPEPARPRREFGSPLDLPQAPPLAADAVTLQRLLQQRRSLRTYGSRPLGAAELGTFLRLVLRDFALIPADPSIHESYETLRRPYPGGGACHELHVYPLVNRCDGLGRGIYCYDGRSDQLLRVAAMNSAAERLVKDAMHSMGSQMPPDVLLCIAARFGRVNWKYEGIAYSLILKDVGVVLQTMYLAATALRLAPCALGCGNTEDFLLATGNTPFEEETVGEFALGSLPESASNGEEASCV